MVTRRPKWVKVSDRVSINLPPEPRSGRRHLKYAILCRRPDFGPNNPAALARIAEEVRRS